MVAWSEQQSTAETCVDLQGFIELTESLSAAVNDLRNRFVGIDAKFSAVEQRMLMYEQVVAAGLTDMEDNQQQMAQCHCHMHSNLSISTQKLNWPKRAFPPLKQECSKPKETPVVICQRPLGELSN